MTDCVPQVDELVSSSQLNVDMEEKVFQVKNILILFFYFGQFYSQMKKIYRLNLY
jgi:hypothetical protein